MVKPCLPELYKTRGSSIRCFHSSIGRLRKGHFVRIIYAVSMAPRGLCRSVIGGDETSKSCRTSPGEGICQFLEATESLRIAGIVINLESVISQLGIICESFHGYSDISKHGMPGDATLCIPCLSRSYTPSIPSIPPPWPILSISLLPVYICV